MERNFSRSLNAVLEHEGGYSDHPKDPGGATNRGVTLANFRRYVKPGGTVEDLKKITAAQAGVVYRRFYWDEVMASDLPDGVDHAVFDFAVNSGPSRAVKFLQDIVGATVDGQIGPQTLKAVATINKVEIINQLCDSRLAFLQRLSTWGTFGKGWASRIKRVRALALEFAGQAVDAPVVTEKLIEVEKPVDVPVVPKGADKQASSWWMGGIGFVGTAASSFMAADLITKLLLLGVGAAAFAFFIWRGRSIAQRVKQIVAEFGS